MDSAAASNLCVLVVEDDGADAYLISRALSRQPAIGLVVRAPDGAEALRMVENGDVEPDLAFIDLLAPRRNGFRRLAAFAGSAERGFPMVVLTSPTASTDAVLDRLRGGMRVVEKPDTEAAIETALAFAIAAVCPLGARAKASGGPLDARPNAHGLPGIHAVAIDER